MGGWWTWTKVSVDVSDFAMRGRAFMIFRKVEWWGLLPDFIDHGKARNTRKRID